MKAGQLKDLVRVLALLGLAGRNFCRRDRDFQLCLVKRAETRQNEAETGGYLGMPVHNNTLCPAA
jgi:hypothetical protein